jgi:hypothetical protein
MDKQEICMLTFTVSQQEADFFNEQVNVIKLDVVAVVTVTWVGFRRR